MYIAILDPGNRVARGYVHAQLSAQLLRELVWIAVDLQKAWSQREGFGSISAQKGVCEQLNMCGERMCATKRGKVWRPSSNLAVVPEPWPRHHRVATGAERGHCATQRSTKVNTQLRSFPCKVKAVEQTQFPPLN
jgi:hypothetical protein